MPKKSTMFWIGSFIFNFMIVAHLAVAVTDSFKIKEWIKTSNFKISLKVFLTYHILPQTVLLRVPEQNLYFVNNPGNLHNFVYL